MINIPDSELAKLIAAHDGDVALLYLFKKLNPEASSEQAAGALFRTMGEISAAEEKLGRMFPASLSPADAAAEESAANTAKPSPVYSADSIPSYSREEVTRCSAGDSTFKALVDEAQRVTGKLLSENFLRILYGIYDHLAMPPEVIMLLLHFCGEKTSLKNGGTGKVSASLLEREAYFWYNNGIMSHELAENFIENSRSKWSGTGKVKEVLGISGRSLSVSEQNYINSWLEMGFAPDAIAIAYDRTVVNTGKLTWKYLNSILKSWHEKKLHTAAEITAAEPSRRQPAQEKQKNGDVDINKLKELTERI